MSEFLDTQIPIVLNSALEEAELTNKAPDYIIVKARISLAHVKTIHRSLYADEKNVVGIEYFDQDNSTIIDKYERVIDAHNKYLAGLNNSYLIKAQ